MNEIYIMAGKVGLEASHRQVQIDDVRVTLGEESENKIIDNYGCPLYECLANTVRCLLSRIPVRRKSTSRDAGTSVDIDLSRSIEYYTNKENIQTSVVDLLTKHSKQFKSVLVLLVDDVPEEALPNNQSEDKDYKKHMKIFYEKVIVNCKSGSTYLPYVVLCIYVVATCVNTPIYILTENEIGQRQWAYFQPLFQYDGQPESVIEYVTMYMSRDKVFHKVECDDNSAPVPHATGLVGMYLWSLEETSPLTIAVPDELLRLPAASKSKLCYSVSRELVSECCELLLKQRLVKTEDYKRMTAHRSSRVDFSMFVTNTQDAFNIVCQVLLKRREKSILKPFVNNWSIFVNTCDFLAKFDALVDLDNAIYERNVSVSAFIDSCKTVGLELDERRKKITTAVIASSSVGIASGGMLIAGLVLAPFTFGASLGLSIAGGAIGVGTGVAAGAARTVEAVKQNTQMKNIKEEQEKIQQKEERVAKALEKIERLFQTSIKKADTTGAKEPPSLSKGSFLAVGSAMRASHSAAGIALAAVKIGTRTAAISASVLGPLSLVFDVAFLAEAAHNKATGDKTNAGELLRRHAETVDMKCKIFNNMLRGNCEEQKRLFEWM
ncbi:uncharacterized protein LOC123524903 [Mercenaria mercenaria]|uniref:uncharacterized protein LOC123524903 n=1 Tax=Mercenaria mercenaria TaxID=6596 RepID=UPI00234E91C2|nr:uncharacterized protein LOC123524903 [Mercenaria mercenaria]